MDYVPKQKDIVWIDFDPSKGREIRKRRPAVVLSSNEYINATHFVIVSPITSTIRDLPTYITLNDQYKIHGQVNCQQIYSYDITNKANRNIEFVEKMKDEDFYRIAQLILWDFHFDL